MPTATRAGRTASKKAITAIDRPLEKVVGSVIGECVLTAPEGGPCAKTQQSTGLQYPIVGFLRQWQGHVSCWTTRSRFRSKKGFRMLQNCAVDGAHATPRFAFPKSGVDIYTC